MAVKDSIGGWKDNAIFFKLPRVCSFFQNSAGPEFQVYLERMGINTTNKCPLPAVNIIMFHIFFYSVI